MASTYTDIGTELMTTGENAGNWGTKTNTNLQILEEALRGYVAQSIAGGVQTTALTYTDGTVGDAARNMVIALTGTITGNQTVTKIMELNIKIFFQGFFEILLHRSLISR